MNWTEYVTPYHEELELRVELIAGDASLQRLLATLHRKRASIEKINYSASSGIASVALLAPGRNADNIVATLAREITLGHVEVVSIDTVWNDARTGTGARGACNDEGGRRR